MPTDLRYPIGKLTLPTEWDAAGRAGRIEIIAETPRNLRAAVQGWSDERLDTPYREGGWTVRQLVHHVADSHMNAYTRLKLALTEENPTIKPYDEAAWAALPDSALPIDLSLDLLDHLHKRWVTVLRAMREEEFSRLLVHPERGPMTLDVLVSIYAWHGPHHVAHIRALAERMGW